MQIKIDHLELGLEQLFELAGTNLEYIDLHISNEKLIISFDGKDKNACNFFIYSSSSNTTPELRSTKKVYKSSLGTTARNSSRENATIDAQGTKDARGK